MNRKLRILLTWILTIALGFSLMWTVLASEPDTQEPIREDPQSSAEESQLSAEVPPEASAEQIGGMDLDSLKQLFVTRIGPSEGDTPGLEYSLYSPVKGEEDTDDYPVMIWLHGMGQGGYERAPLDGSEVARFASEEYQAKLGTGAYIVVPRAPEDKQSYWGPNLVPVLLGVIEELCETEQIDENRIYIGGFSLGGMMTWRTVIAQPTLFAAAFPICPAYRPGDAELALLADLPIWIIHGKQDPVCAFGTFTEGVKEKLEGYGNAGVRLTVLDPILNPDGTPGSAETKVQSQHHAWVPVTYDLFL